MENAINTVTDVLGLWNTLVELATDIGQSQWTVIKWKKRQAIPPEYWQAICDAAARRDKQLSADDLMRVHAAPTPEPSRPGSSVAA